MQVALAKIENLVRRKVPDDGEHIWGFADLTGLLHQRFRGYDYGILVGKKLDDSIIDSVIDGPNTEYHKLYVDTNRYLSGMVKELAEELTALDIKSLAINPTPSEVDRADDY